MIKIKNILFENEVPDIFIPRKLQDRTIRFIQQYINNGSRGNLTLNHVKLTKLPEILKNVEVEGDFDCSGNYLDNLENFPKKVGGSINISYNFIKTLEGMNVDVIHGAGFDCSGNELKSLKGGPKMVYGDYLCVENDLITLEGAPQIVPGSFVCSYNNLTSLRGAPIKVGKDFACNFNKIDSLEGLPKEIGHHLYIIVNHKIFTVKEIRSISNIKGNIYLI